MAGQTRDQLANTQLANFNLGSQLGALSGFAGKAVSNSDTLIQNASVVARVAPEGTKADNINLNVPAIGVITGAGTVSPTGELAFKMLADLNGGVVGGLSKVAGATSGQGGIPFAIQGTTANPKFVPDVGGIAGGLATGAVGAVGAVGDISSKAPVPATKDLTKESEGSSEKRSNSICDNCSGAVRTALKACFQRAVAQSAAEGSGQSR